MGQPRRSLRTELLVNLGFVTSAAVILVGLNTVLLLGGDLAEAWRPLVVLWLGSMLVFVLFGSYLVHRLVIRPLQQLAAEADTLARGMVPAEPPAYETRELGLLADRYRAMAEELLDAQSHMVRVEKLAGIGRLAAGVAHEIRNPLGALGTYTDVLCRRGSDPAVTGEMHTAIGRIDRIVQGLLDYARPAATNGTRRAAAPDGANLDIVVRTAVDFLVAQGLLRTEALELRLAPALPPVRGDAHGLEQVVINLLVNAAQAAPAGRITIGTVAQDFEPRHGAAQRREGAEGNGRRRWAARPRRPDLAAGAPGVILYVADEGPGVPEPDRERIFDPFFTTKEPGEGTGLGLAIVARTVHEAGGVVWVDRAREGGAVFKVFLPHASAADACADR
ncbi:MAG TPA: HAMP domain-containing sensor histidine kinase [Gemmatimonadales bacterium]|nr:HAMP domain-containing sensor histidine kinase [Gemmatimonadales bacterium]